MKCRCQVPDHVTCILFCVFSCSYNGLKQVSTLKRRKCRNNDKLNNILLIILLITKGCGVWATTIEGQNAFALSLCFGKFHMTDNQNTRDPITSDRKSNSMWSNCILCIPFILSGSLNECWLHTSDASVITTWRFGLRAPVVPRNYDVINVSFSEW